jgi:hypothetical protein
MAAAPRYRRERLTFHSAGEGQTLIHCAARGLARVLPAPLATALSQLTQFDTLEGHVDAVRRFGTLDPAQLEQFAALLPGLAKEEFLLAVRQLFRAVIDRHDPEKPRPKIQTLGIATRDRLDCLRRCLSGFFESCRAHGRSIRVIVADDSESPEQTRALLGSLAPPPGSSIAYAGPGEKRDHLRRLARKTDLPQDLLNFALFGPGRGAPTYGGNRNALLLETRGECFLSLDDDIEWRIAAPPEPREAIRYSSLPDPLECWWYPDLEAATRAATFRPVDLLAEHEKLLGSEAGDCVLQLPERFAIQWECPDDELVDDLLSGNARVRLTQTGALGDSATRVVPWILEATGRTRERLLASEASYRSALSSRQVLRLAPAYTISNREPFMGFAAGYDHREALPPFLPAYCNEEGTLRWAMKACSRNGYVGHVPWALVHRPPGTRVNAPDQMVQDARGVSCHLPIFSILGQCPPAPAGSPVASRMRLVGEQMRLIGAMSPHAFGAFAREAVVQNRTALIHRLEIALERERAKPDYWEKDVRAMIRDVRETLASPGFIFLKELNCPWGTDEGMARLQELVGRYGQLLEHWDTIVRASRELREEGHPLALPVDWASASG